MDGGILGFVDVKDRSKKIMVDCSGISIVLCGSFERMLQAKSEFASKSLKLSPFLRLCRA